jgi:SAM-dependent methyltransferase
MFLSQRATQAEYCDRPDLPLIEVASHYSQLARINRWLLAADPFQRVLVRWLGRTNVGDLSILDLGGGDGAMGRSIETWAWRHGWSWRVTNLDLSIYALRLNSGRRNVAAAVGALPFADNSFDVVIASQMAHHLTNEEALQHFREAWRVTRDALLLADAHRNVLVWCAIGGVLRLMRATPHFLSDGLLSVRRSWRLGEWRELAARAEIPSARVWLYYGSRVMLQARKRRPGEAASRTLNCDSEREAAVAG